MPCAQLRRIARSLFSYAPRHEPRHWAAYQCVRNEGEQNRDEQCLQRIDPAKNDELIGDVDHQRDDEHLGDGPEAFTKQSRTIMWARQHGPEVRRALESGVRNAGAHRKNHGHQGLQQKSKPEQAIEPSGELLPRARELVHRLAVLSAE